MPTPFSPWSPPGLDLCGPSLFPDAAHPCLSLPTSPSPDPLTGKWKAVGKALDLRPMSDIATHLSLWFLICKMELKKAT